MIWSDAALDAASGLFPSEGPVRGLVALGEGREGLDDVEKQGLEVCGVCW